MPIIRLSAQEIRGFVIDNNQQRATEILAHGRRAFGMLIDRAISEYNLELEVCSPGTINITPKYWRRNRADHILEVLPDGESARYKVVPREHGLPRAAHAPVAGEVMAQDLQTTRIINLPEETYVVPLAGPVREDPRIRLHELVMYLPPKLLD